MKVLLINTVWKRASTGKIAYAFYNELIKRGHECRFLYGRIDKTNTDENIIALDTKLETKLHRKINRVTGYHSTFAPNALKRLKKVVEEFQPDIVQLYNLHGDYLDIYGMFDYLSEKKIPIVYGMLDEHPYLGYCCYAYDCDQFKYGCQQCKRNYHSGYMWSLFFNRARETFLLKEKAYKKNNIVFTGPKWVLERARESALLKDAHLEEVDEFVENESIFVPRDGGGIREHLLIKEDEIMILNVAPSSDLRKGVRDFIQMAEKCRDKRFKFVNVGYQGTSDKLPKNFIGIGFVSDQKQLAEYYSAADALVCTSYADTMPNVCLEALSCGTPVYGYEVTGIPYVAQQPCGNFVPVGDVDAMLKELSSIFRKDTQIQKQCRSYAEQRYSLRVYADKMIKIYEETLHNL